MTEQPFALSSQTLGALPIVDVFLARMRVDELLGRCMGPRDRRVALEPAKAIGLLVRNLCVSREPIYALGEWAAAFDPRASHFLCKRCGYSTSYSLMCQLVTLILQCQVSGLRSGCGRRRAPSSSCRCGAICVARG